MEPTVSSLVCSADAPPARPHVRHASVSRQAARDAAAASLVPRWTWRPLLRSVTGSVGVVYLFPLAILAVGLPIAAAVATVNWLIGMVVR
jgi:hypothetical protein